MGRARVKGSLKRAVVEYPGEILLNSAEMRKHRGHWQEYFSNDWPLRLEVGMGRGRFLADLSGRGGQVNLIGLELKPDRCVTARRKIRLRAKVPFLLLCNFAELLPQIFAPGELDRIYLNFPDPWPNFAYRQRRLFNSLFLKTYASVLREGGELWFKSDQEDAWRELLESLPQRLVLLEHGTDMHAADWSSEGIITEYERRYLSEGRKISYARLLHKQPRVIEHHYNCDTGTGGNNVS